MSDGDLSVTALYTSGVWAWAGFPGADLFRSGHSDRVFAVTNAVLAVASWFVPGAPSLRHSLAQRHAIIDHLVREAAPDTVVELAAGLSRRGAHLSSDGLAYVEVDLPRVVAHKEALLARTEAGREVLGRPNLRRIAADVRDLALEPLVGGRTVVVAEGLLMYLDAEAQRALWRRVAAAVPDGCLVFDLVPAIEQPDPWIGRVLGALMRVFTRGRGFEKDTRTRDDIARELIDAGFGSVRWVEPADLDGSALVPYREARTQTLVFCATRGDPT